MNTLIILGSGEIEYLLARSYYEVSGRKAIVVSDEKDGLCKNSTMVDYRSCTYPTIVHTLKSVIDEKTAARGTVEVTSCSPEGILALRTAGIADLPGVELLVPGLEVFSSFVYKDNLYAKAKSLGIKVPTTHEVDVYADYTSLSLKELGLRYPFIAKPADPAKYSLISFPKKAAAYVITSYSDVVTLLRVLKDSGYNGKLLLQDYIPGKDTAFRTVTFAGDFVVGSQGLLVNKTRNGFGEFLAQEVYPITGGDLGSEAYKDHLINELKVLTRTLNYDGLLTAVIKRHSGTGEAYLISVSPYLTRLAANLTPYHANLYYVLKGYAYLADTRSYLVDNTISANLHLSGEARKRALKHVKEETVYRPLNVPDSRYVAAYCNVDKLKSSVKALKSANTIRLR